jgi:hypothetical protein
MITATESQELDTAYALEYALAEAGKSDRWVPAGGGKERMFPARSGARLLYCYNFHLGRHAYLNCDTDTILTDEEAAAHMQMY